MTLLPPPDPANQSFSWLDMDEQGRFLGDDGKPVPLASLKEFLKRVIVLPEGITDAFVWVHGWRTDEDSAERAAQQLFQGIEERWSRCKAQYPGLTAFKPAFVTVHWPSMSSVMPWGYAKIKGRAQSLIKNGEAEFFLSSLLGYLEEAKGFDGPTLGLLKSRGGFYVHCLGHSFGGRFLTAAIHQAGFPESPRSGTLALNDRDRANGYRYSVDSTLVFQMAAPNASFGKSLDQLVNSSPLGGPLVVTWSSHDRANCVWHRMTEWTEAAIGCCGASEPRRFIRGISLKPDGKSYTAEDFAAKIVNVDSSWLFRGSRFDPVGAHSDIWHHESIHLALSLAEHVRTLE
jgi:hypothetical protein